MKKLFVLLVALVATPVAADVFYGGKTQNCDIDAMVAELDRATVNGHGAVITHVDCVQSNVSELPESVEYSAQQDVVASVHVEPRPVYRVYRPRHQIKTVDCVPGPIVEHIPDSDCEICK